MTPIKNIVFDMGGVLVDLHLQRCLDAFRSIGFDSIDQEINDPYYSCGMFKQNELGYATAEQLYAYIRSRLGRNITNDEIRDTYLQFIGEVADYKLDMLRTLRERGFRVMMLSNTGDVVYPYVAQTQFTKQGLTVNDYFERIYLSYELHILKPDRAIFDHIVSDAGIVPSETLFIDDGPSNTAAAERLGFATYTAQQDEDYRHIFENIG